MLSRSNPITDGWKDRLRGGTRCQLAFLMVACGALGQLFLSWPVPILYAQDDNAQVQADAAGDEPNPGAAGKDAKPRTGGAKADHDKEQRVGRLIRITAPI